MKINEKKIWFLKENTLHIWMLEFEKHALLCYLLWLIMLHTLIRRVFLFYLYYTIWKRHFLSFTVLFKCSMLNEVLLKVVNILIYGHRNRKLVYCGHRKTFLHETNYINLIFHIKLFKIPFNRSRDTIILSILEVTEY